MKGARELKKKLEALRDGLPSQLAAALYTEAVIIEHTSRERTPVLTGALRASHETLEPVETQDEVSCTIQVGGPAIPYAIKIHESVEMFHRVGQAKFLESAVLEAKRGLAQRIAQRLEFKE
jgi:hypothetical protein